MSTHALSFQREAKGAHGFSRVVMAAAAAAALVTAASWLGSQYWLLELLTHFRVQYLIGAIVLLVAAIVLRMPGTALLAAAVAAANLAAVWSYVMPAAIDVRADAADGHGSMRLVSVNVGLRNRDYGLSLAMVREENPDIVGFLEVDERWAERLSDLHDIYPYRILRPEEGAYGLALFSRYPLRELSDSPYIENGVQTAIMVEVEREDAPVSLILTHLMAPTSPGKAQLRNRQLETLARMTRAAGNTARILIGDLNITPWSPDYVLLEAEAGLKNAARARGYWPTWPTGFNVVKIPIDHCLVSDGLRVQLFRTGSDIGSDHLPIIVDVSIADTVQSKPRNPA